jgi:hypothetical protein
MFIGYEHKEIGTVEEVLRNFFLTNDENMLKRISDTDVLTISQK